MSKRRTFAVTVRGHPVHEVIETEMGNFRWRGDQLPRSVKIVGVKAHIAFACNVPVKDVKLTKL